MRLEIKFIVGILVFGVGLSGVLMVANPIRKDEDNKGFPVLSAIPVFYSNLKISNKEDIFSIINRNFWDIMENTSKILPLYGIYDTIEIEKMIFIINSSSVEKRGWQYDKYWLGPNKTAYVCFIPAVTMYDIWNNTGEKILVERIKIKNVKPGQIISIPNNITSYQKAKEYLLEKYPEAVEIYWKPTNSWVKFLIDEDGTLYWAGWNLEFPWSIS